MNLKPLAICTLLVSGALLSSVSHTVIAGGDLPGTSSSAVAQGQLGFVYVDPYHFSPLVALIDLGGKQISDVSVEVKGSGKKGVDIRYQVSQNQLNTHDGIPVFGLYPDLLNTVNVRYKLNGAFVNETYRIRTSALPHIHIDGQERSQYEYEAVTVADGFQNRFYLVDGQVIPPNVRDHWDWLPTQNIIDTNGDVRWHLNAEVIYDRPGGSMSFKQTSDGKLIFGQGVMFEQYAGFNSAYYAKYDFIGKPILKRTLPRGFIGLSHEITEMPNGHLLLRVGKKDYLTKEGLKLDTVRDHVIEVDSNGDVVKVWDFNKILDPLRDTVLKSLDMGAVCLNVDVKEAGKTRSAEQLANEPFGDVAGVGTGRNWIHINSIGYDASDDSIIISSRHQSAVVKVGRDDEVKWILGTPEGWSDALAAKVLTPVDSQGEQLRCDKGGCDGEFDWSWTQHTAWPVPERGTVTVFDNGDGRGLKQPFFATDKYSRGVEYKVDMDKMTVQQVWEYGKERGYEWYSPITSITQWQADHQTMFMASASAGLLESDKAPEHWITEVDPKTNEVKVEIKVKTLTKHEPGYRSTVVHPEKMFSQ
ncbi:aryl-sulfate sulfotransferase [Shewanella woodyi]|uniref:aryl-sulfate sulfotransferase n=1 Tax=Shewanella woodyi TaxID=60961 RepID=UPI0007EB644A|nr:aryl-sulfate sulfotransferase [Shewanella woodyi]